MKGLAKLLRPRPPATDEAEGFWVSEDLAQWAMDVLIKPEGKLANPDHAHLQIARIGFLWTNIVAERRMVMIAGQAELPTPPSSLGPWARARFEHQLAGWFPGGLDFLITIFSGYAEIADDASFCALIDHELYHCGQRSDEFGNPKFRRDGTPVFGIRGHDVEEFVGIVRRYGAGAAAGKTAQLVQAARVLPEIKASQIAGACGTCRSQVA